LFNIYYEIVFSVKPDKMVGRW